MKHQNRLALMACSFWLLPFFAGAQVNVLTYHNDNSRLGANLNETELTPANVNAANFGKLFSYAVDGYVYAQPLYVSGLNIPGQGTYNVVFVATEHNSVYAFDADSNGGANGGLLWQVNLGTSAPTPKLLPFRAIQPEVGITGTPAIDLSSGTLYVDAFTQNGKIFSHSIHALSILDGSEKPGSPVAVSVSIHATGTGSTGGTLPFQAVQELQRSALTLANGILYVAYAGYTDTQQTDPFHGWIIGFNASNLQLLPNYVFNSTPDGTKAQFGATAGEGGIWMGGGGLAVDDNNNLYFSTGDGNFNAFPNNAHATEYGNSVIELSTSGGLAVADYFTPYNESFFSTNDVDVGSGGVILLPDQPGPNPHLMIGAGKPQEAYLINRDMMTTDGQHINTSSQVNNIVQEMPLGNGSYDTPAYFNEQVYYVATKDVIRSYVLSNGTLVADLPGTFGTRTFGFPGATPSISANGGDNGIVWAVQNASPAVLVAYDATDLSSELYNSTQAGSRDQLTGGVKFVVPTVANGKVYVGSQGAVSVFGLLDANPPAQWKPMAATFNGLFFEPSGVEFGASGAVSITMTRRGVYSGRLQFAANSYSFHGSFDANGAATANVAPKKGGGGSLTVTLQVNTNDNNFISGTVSSNSWSANLFANRAAFSARANRAPFAGTYNVTFPGPGDGNPNYPQNNGSGKVTVNAPGKAKFKGMLGDGTKVTQSAEISQFGDWPFFLSLYNRQGEIIGWLNFNGTNVSGQTTWIKESNPRSKSFPGGFVLTTTVSGSAQ